MKQSKKMKEKSLPTFNLPQERQHLAFADDRQHRSFRQAWRRIVHRFTDASSGSPSDGLAGDSEGVSFWILLGQRRARRRCLLTSCPHTECQCRRVYTDDTRKRSAGDGG